MWTLGLKELTLFCLWIIACPGSPPCNWHGSCSDKVTGNGTCTCQVRVAVHPSSYSSVHRLIASLEAAEAVV